MTALQDLRERVGKAAGSDWELSRDIAVALTGWCLHPYDRRRDDSAQSDTGSTCLDCGADSWGNTGPTGQRLHEDLPPYTASIDAAVALIERVAPRFQIILGQHDAPGGRGTLWRATLVDPWTKGLGAAEWSPTAPLALIASLLASLPDQGGE